MLGEAALAKCLSDTPQPVLQRDTCTQTALQKYSVCNKGQCLRLLRGVAKKVIFKAYTNVKRSVLWFWMFIISSAEHYKKNKGMAPKTCSFGCKIQPEVLMLFCTRFSLVGNGKKNVGKCTKVVSSVLPGMPVHLNPEFDPVWQSLCSQDMGGKAQGFFFSASSFCNQQKVSQTFLASSRKHAW